MLEWINKHRWPLIVALLAALIRIIYLLELSRLPDFVVPMVDERWHWIWANTIIDKSFWETGVWFRAPLYPYFLALMSLITGGSIFWSKLLQVLLSGPTAWLIYRLSEHLFSRKVAIAAGIVYALYGTIVFYDAMFMIPALFLMLTVWAMYRLVAYRDEAVTRTWLLTGVVFGLAAISRPNILITVPLLMLWLYFTENGVPPLTQRLRKPLLMLAGVVIVIAPITIRNVAVTGETILISSQGGINLYLGNNPEADGLTMLMPEIALDESLTWSQFQDATRTVAERETGRTMGEGEQSSYWTGKAIDFIIDHPGDFISLLWRKTVYLLSGFENSDNIDIYHQRTKSTLLSLLVFSAPIDFPFGLLLPLTLVGVYALRDQWRKLLPLYIFLLAYIPSIILFLVTARHRLPLIPFMIIIACGGVAALSKSLRQFSPKQLVIALLLFLVPLFVFNRTYYEEVGVSDFQNYLNEGIRYERLGDYARAEEAYKKADLDYPYSAMLLNNLAHAQMMLGKNQLAERNLYRALAADNTFGPAYNNLGILLMGRGANDSAITLYRAAAQLHDADVSGDDKLSQYMANIGDAFLAKQMPDSADAYYRQAISIAPDYARAYFKAASFYARMNAFGKADSLYTAGQQLGRPTPADLFNWGLSYLRRREYTPAIAKMKQVIEADSTFYQAYHVIAVGYHENHLSPDSVNRYLDAALRFNPSYRPAVELKKIVSGRN